jgi:hypothetical protein
MEKQEREDKLRCGVCSKIFSSVSTKNRHLKVVHGLQEEKTYQHICCPLCDGEKKWFENHEILICHLKEVHDQHIKECNLSFSSFEEFKAWRAQENREVNYAYHRSIKRVDGGEYIYYNCNRSNSRGFHSKCTKRAMKTGGTIWISGVCPSRIIVNILENGMVKVKFIETHVGHQDELRTKQLTKAEESKIVEQLQAGVSNERILQDARKIRDNQLEQINLITRGDLAYLIRKFNIDKRRDADDMVATALKV